MRILLLAPHPFFQHRGTPLAEKALIEVLGAEGHDIDVLAFHEGEDIPLPRCRIHRIPRPPGVGNIRPGFSPGKLLCDAFLLVSAIRLLRAGRYDLVHAVEESVLIAAALRPFLGVPYVYDMDSSLPEQMTDRYPLLRPLGPALRLAERTAIRGSAGILAVCRAVEEIAERHARGQPVARVEDTTLLVDRADDPIARIPPGGPVVMYVGNLEPYQGLDLLLRSGTSASRLIPDLRLVIVGGADAHIAEYRRRGEDLGLTGRLIFTGEQPIEHLAAYLRQADVLVSPRLSGRNTPMKIYSYMDSGRAVLATRIQSHTQVLDDEIACLVEPSPEAMSAALVELIRDPGRREALGRRARDRVQALYTPAAARTKILEFFDAVQTRLREGAAAA
ncbi:MAG TPA: glycosyltransferase family 4 protein [Vicinamibacterales bacterium]|nr:glycosyltransferase family 4 protein [Vicinamibacterales bacterium]